LKRLALLSKNMQVLSGFDTSCTFLQEMRNSKILPVSCMPEDACSLMRREGQAKKTQDK
jgi:hypothetical protein